MSNCENSYTRFSPCFRERVWYDTEMRKYYKRNSILGLCMRCGRPVEESTFGDFGEKKKKKCAACREFYKNQYFERKVARITAASKGEKMDSTHCFTCNCELVQGDSAICFGCKCALRMRAELMSHVVGKDCYRMKNELIRREPIPISFFWSVEYFWYVWYFIRERMGKRQPDRIIELLFRDLTPHDKDRVSNYLLKVGVPREMYPCKPSLEEHIELEKQLYEDLDEIFSRLYAVRSAATSQTTPGVAATGSLGGVVEGAVPVMYRPSCTEEPK